MQSMDLEIGPRFVKQTTFQCDVAHLYIILMLESIETREDFINVVLMCSLEESIRIMKLVILYWLIYLCWEKVVEPN